MWVFGLKEHLVGLAGCVSAHMCISMLVSLYAQRKDRSRVWGGDIHTDLCGLSEGYSP